MRRGGHSNRNGTVVVSNRKRRAAPFLAAALFVGAYGNGFADAATVVTTVAGNGQAGHAGDGGPATAAALNRPAALAVDAAGGLYVADRPTDVEPAAGTNGEPEAAAGRLRVVTPDGVIVALLSVRDPRALALDAAGNLYFASPASATEGGGDRIWKRAAADGALTLIAGSGAADFSGDDGPAVAAGLTVAGLALDAAGNVWFADAAARRVRRVSAADGTVATVVGSGEPLGDKFVLEETDDVDPLTAAAEPTGGLALSPSGDLYFSERAWNRVRRWSAADGKVRLYAGWARGGFRGDAGPARTAWLRAPAGLCCDAVGNLYIADQGNQRVRCVAPDGSVMITVAGNGATGFSGDGGDALDAAFNEPAAVALDAAGRLFIADYANRRVRRVQLRGEIRLTASPLEGDAPLTVAFSAVGRDAADGEITAFQWAFGDGSAATGAAADHAYAAPGVYRVEATGTSAAGDETYADWAVVVVGAADGLGPDVTPPSTTEAVVDKLKARLNFAAAGKDQLTSRLIVEFPAGFRPENVVVLLALGGVVREFTLDNRGYANRDDGALHLLLKVRDNLPDLLYVDVLLWGDLADELEAAGVKRSEDQNEILSGLDAALLLGGQRYTGTFAARCKGKAGRGANLKLKP